MAERELQIKVTLDDQGAAQKVDNLNDKLRANDNISKMVAETEKRLDASFKELDKSVAAAERSVDKLTQNKTRAATATDVLAQKVMQFAGPTALMAAYRNIIMYGDAIDDNATKLGMLASAYDQLTGVARRFGIESGSIVNSMLSLSDRIAGGDKSAAGALRRLNIDLADFENSSPDEMFYKLAAAVKELNTHQERVAVLSDLGGRSFRQMAGMMSEDIAKIKGEMPAMTDSVAKELGRQADEWDLLVRKIKNAAATIVAVSNAGTRAAEEFWNPSQATPFRPRGRDLEIPKSDVGPNESTDLMLGLSKSFTDNLSARPPEFGGGAPGFLPGASAMKPGDEFWGGMTGQMPGGLQQQPFDAAQGWADYWASLSQGASTVPPVIDEITTSTKEATSAFRDMGIAAGIALSVPLGTSLALAYAEAGVGSGLGAGARPLGDAGIQVMDERMRRDLANTSGGAFGGAGKIGGGPVVNINANGAFFQSEAMIKQLADQVGQAIAQAYGNARKW